MAIRKQHSIRPATTGSSQSSLASWISPRGLWSSGAFLLGMLLVWSLLAPQDATSVFEGFAVPQNLFWLGLAAVAPLATARVGASYAFSQRQWMLVIACLSWFVLSSIMAGRDNNPRVAWNGFWQIMALAGCYFSARGLIVGPHARRAIVLILLVGSVALACHGLHQVWIEFPADRARYLADPEGELAKVPGLDAPLGSVARQRFEDRLLHSSEPYGTFALANSLAVFLSGGIVLLMGLGIAVLRDQSRATREEAKSPLGKGPLVRGQSRVVPYVAWCVALCLILLCWFLTRSRVAYPALLIGAVYWMVSSGSRVRDLRRWFPWIAGVGATGFIAGIVWLLRNDSLVLSEAPKSLSYRVDYWLATLSMLREHWLFGIGLGNFQSYYPIYKLPAASEIIADPHNWLLDILVCLSLPLGVVLTIWIGWRLWPRQLSRVDLGAVGPDPTAAHASTNKHSIHNIDVLSGRSLLWGAGLGGAACALLLNLLSGMDLWIAAITWIPAVVVVFLLRPMFGSDLAEQNVTLRAAAVTMLACLLVSGSWQASGIAVPLLLLLIPRHEDFCSAEKVPNTSPLAPAWSSWTTSVLPLLGLLLFLIQCWRPTTSSWSLMQQAMLANAPQQQLDLTIIAAQADPLNSEPLRWQVQLLTHEAVLASAEQFPELAARALEATDRWLAIDSVKSLNWEWAGRHALELAAKEQHLGLDHQKTVEQALRYYSQGLARYPSNIGLRAQLAATLAIAGRWTEVQAELEIAKRLDDQTPHLDKKLRSQQLWLPLLPEGADEAFVAEQPWVAAEPMVAWLRKAISEQ